MAKRIRITHLTEYQYKEPVEFGPHRALLRPREGHDLHIEDLRVEVEPAASVKWFRDIYDNCITLLTFEEPGKVLRVKSEVDVDLFTDDDLEFPIAAQACDFPFQYDADEQIEIVPYRLPSYPHHAPSMLRWLKDLYEPGSTHSTMELLQRLNTRIFEAFRYDRSEASGVQLPCETLSLGSGSCRDFAVFMMEAARHWGFAARFVTGYFQMAEGRHGATRKHEKAAPIAGTWSGPAEAYVGMNVVVQVFEL